MYSHSPGDNVRLRGVEGGKKEGGGEDEEDALIKMGVKCLAGSG